MKNTSYGWWVFNLRSGENGGYNWGWLNFYVARLSCAFSWLNCLNMIKNKKTKEQIKKKWAKWEWAVCTNYWMHQSECVTFGRKCPECRQPQPSCEPLLIRAKVLQRVVITLLTPTMASRQQWDKDCQLGSIWITQVELCTCKVQSFVKMWMSLFLVSIKSRTGTAFKLRICGTNGQGALAVVPRRLGLTHLTPCLRLQNSLC